MSLLGASIVGNVSTQVTLNANQHYALKILHTASHELEEMLAQKIDENPFLQSDEEEENLSRIEESDPIVTEIDNESPSLLKLEWDNESVYSKFQQSWSDDEDDNQIENFSDIYPTDLKSYLEKLWNEQHLSTDENKKSLGSYIIQSLNEDGFLEEDLSKISLDMQVPENFCLEVLQSIQMLDPKGFAARNIQECLIIQTRQLRSPLVAPLIAIIENHLKEVALKSFKKISNSLKISVTEVMEATKLLQSLDPKPSRKFKKDFNEGLNPDFFIKVNHENKSIKIIGQERDITHSVGIDKGLVQSYKTAGQKITSLAMKEKLTEAKQLIKALEQRRSTLHRLMEYIVEKQKGFFLEGPQKLISLSMMEAAESLGCHESTISRACHKKFAATSWGIFELNYFFSHTLETFKVYKNLSETHQDNPVNALKARVENYIRNEDKAQPLSDEKIAEMISESGTKIARRTITKYRESLGILPLKLRRQIS
jgi:RNA polymerase sigma-54 factor